MRVSLDAFALCFDVSTPWRTGSVRRYFLMTTRHRTLAVLATLWVGGGMATLEGQVDSVLGSQKLTAFVSTHNPARAKVFYRDTLGLHLLSEDSFALVLTRTEPSCVSRSLPKWCWPSTLSWAGTFLISSRPPKACVGPESNWRFSTDFLRMISASGRRPTGPRSRGSRIRMGTS